MQKTLYPIIYLAGFYDSPHTVYVLFQMEKILWHKEFLPLVKKAFQKIANKKIPWSEIYIWERLDVVPNVKCQKIEISKKGYKII